MILNYQHINQDISNYPATICFLPNMCIENVTKFRYLGDMIVFNEPSTGDTEVELRIEMSEYKFYELSKSFMNIRLPTRIKILNAVVRSRLTYSSNVEHKDKTKNSNQHFIHRNASKNG